MDLLEFDIDFLSQKLAANSSSPIFARLADLYLAKGQPEEALKLCEEGVAIHPTYASGFILLGRCYLAQQNKDKAEKALTRALQLTPYNQVARKLLYEIAPPPPVEEHVFEIEDLPKEEIPESAEAASTFPDTGEQEIAAGPESPTGEEQAELIEHGSTFPSLDEYVQAHSAAPEMAQSLDDFLNGPTSQPATETEDNFGALAAQLEQAGRIVPNEPEPVTPMRPDEAMTFESNIVTPTLAEIYASQGEYGAAIQAYEILMLSKPEDRDRFERRIQELYQMELNRG
jgi:tetratricopeptide (TPR) repeat protein